MRDVSKARGVEHTGVFERRVTPLAAMQRRPNALVILRRAPSSVATVGGATAFEVMGLPRRQPQAGDVCHALHREWVTAASASGFWAAVRFRLGVQVM